MVQLRVVRRQGHELEVRVTSMRVDGEQGHVTEHQTHLCVELLSGLLETQQVLFCKHLIVT